jgi:hypothetical protein
MNKNFAINALKNRINSAQFEIEKFKTRLDKDPADALSWSLTAFQCAAKLKVLNLVTDALESGEEIEQVCDSLLNRVMTRSKYPAQSSSPTSNLIDQYELAAYAEILSDLKDWAGKQ